MKVIVCEDKDAEILLAKMRLKERELLDRWGQQSQDHRYVASETVRGLMFELIGWLQAQGFKTT